MWVARATPFLAAVGAVAAILLVVPRTPRHAPPAAPAPAPRPPAPVTRQSPVTAPGPTGSASPREVAASLRTAQARLGRIPFELGKVTLDGASEPALREVAAILGRAPDARVVVEGHTDDTGSAAWNMKMSQARAEAVVRWLVDRGGIASRRLTAKGRGGTRPVADNATEAGQAANRRVEFSVVGIPETGGTESSKPVIRRKPAVAAAEPVHPQAQRRSEPAVAAVAPRQTYTGTRFVLSADRFTTSGPELISAAGHVRIEPVTPGEPYVAVVDGFSRTLTGPATGVVGEVVNPGEHLILHTGAKGTPVHPVP